MKPYPIARGVQKYSVCGLLGFSIQISIYLLMLQICLTHVAFQVTAQAGASVSVAIVM